MTTPRRKTGAAAKPEAGKPEPTTGPVPPASAEATPSTVAAPPAEDQHPNQRRYTRDEVLARPHLIADGAFTVADLAGALYGAEDERLTASEIRERVERFRATTTTPEA